MAEGAAPPTPREVRTIDTEQDVDDALAALIQADPRLAAISRIAGPLPLRRRPAGFEGLAAIITAQQISSAAAASIWGRLASAVEPFTAGAFLAAPEDALRAAGLSRPKIRTLACVATACVKGFDLDALHGIPADEALAALVALDGIGPWTAEIYLLFCLGHPDIFPAGDLALQVAVQHALGFEHRPKERALREIAQAWSPWRGVAARLFWAYYGARQTARPAGKARRGAN